MNDPAEVCALWNRGRWTTCSPCQLMKSALWPLVEHWHLQPSFQAELRREWGRGANSCNPRPFVFTRCVQCWAACNSICTWAEVESVSEGLTGSQPGEPITKGGIYKKPYTERCCTPTAGAIYQDVRCTRKVKIHICLSGCAFPPSEELFLFNVTCV